LNLSKNLWPQGLKRTAQSLLAGFAQSQDGKRRA
jgi:hypothetical protein